MGRKQSNQEIQEEERSLLNKKNKQGLEISSTGYGYTSLPQDSKHGNQGK